MLDLMSWWEWLEEELLSPNSTLLPSTQDRRDAELYARWSKIKSGYLDYYNIVRDLPRTSSGRSNDASIILGPCCLYTLSAVVDDFEFSMAVNQFSSAPT
jgi:hypothetical protein